MQGGFEGLGPTLFKVSDLDVDNLAFCTSCDARWKRDGHSVTHGLPKEVRTQIRVTKDYFFNPELGFPSST